MTSPFPAVRVASTRFRSRHVHRTVAEFLHEKLRELGWVNDPVNFGAKPVIFREIQPDENGLAVEANTVSVSAGDLGTEAESQLGGGIYEVVIPFFIDVYGESSGVAQSIGEDLKEQVGYGRILPLLDWSDVQLPIPAYGAYIEFENATGPERPQASQVSADFRRNWRVVKVEAHVHYAETGDNSSDIVAFSGIGPPTIEGLPDAKPGDTYTDTVTGIVYRLG
jgi:hypothetical protein